MSHKVFINYKKKNSKFTVEKPCSQFYVNEIIISINDRAMWSKINICATERLFYFYSGKNKGAWEDLLTGSVSNRTEDSFLSLISMCESPNPIKVFQMKHLPF